MGQVNSSPINVGPGQALIQNGTVNNNGSGLANQGNMGTATITDSGSNIVTSSITSPVGPVQGIQTVALTQLKQVNAGVSIGNNNSLYGSGATINANSTNTASNGVISNSNSIGVASNSAAQNVVNVSANISQSR